VFCFLLHLPSACCFLQGSSPMNELCTIHPLILKRNRRSSESEYRLSKPHVHLFLWFSHEVNQLSN
jgi:hypothetical protein